MNRSRLGWILAIGAIFLLTACTGANQPPPNDAEVHPVVKEDDQGKAEDSDSAAEDSEPEPAAIDPAVIFSSNCARCHKTDRSGAKGPSLLPDRLTKEASHYAETITNGSGPMPSFGGRLSVEEINALAEWILTPVE